MISQIDELITEAIDWNLLDYGLWIDIDGSVVRVKQPWAHLKVIQFMVPDYDTYEDAYAEGWVKVTLEDTHLGGAISIGSGPNITNDQKKVILDVIKEYSTGSPNVITYPYTIGRNSGIARSKNEIISILRRV